MITIRKAKKSDTSSLEKLFLTTREQTFHWESPNKFKLEDYKKATDSESVFVAEDDHGTIIGFVSVWEKDEFPFVHHLFVAPEHQRKRVGELLTSVLG